MEPRDPNIARLQALLMTPGLPGQSVIATAADVDQGLVSRARTGALRRLTPRVARLLQQVEKQVDDLGVLADAITDVALAKPITEMASDKHRQAVWTQVERYLADGLDGQLLIQQLAVLRRAQRRRAGRPTKDLKPGRLG